MSNTQKIVYDEKNAKIILNGKPYTKDEIRNFSILFLVLGIFLSIISLFIMPIGLIFMVLGLYILLQSVIYHSCIKTLESKMVALKKEPEIQTNKENTYIEITKPVSSNIHISVESNKGRIDMVHNTEIHNVAGTSYRQKEIASLKSLNEDFSLTKAEIIELCMVDEKIYQYSFDPIDIQLIEDPNNEHDSNAIKVVIDGIHVGYIKKESCLHIKELIRTDKIKQITADIHGGKYKMLVSDYDIEKDTEVYTMEKNETDFFVVLSIELND